MVHQLPSGLAIYKCFLSSHNNKYNCLIGGPHKSFELVAGQVGNVPALISHFVQGIQTYKTWGPPKIPSLPFTLEDELFAQEMNGFVGDVKQVFHCDVGLENVDVDFSEVIDQPLETDIWS